MLGASPSCHVAFSEYRDFLDSMGGSIFGVLGDSPSCHIYLTLSIATGVLGAAPSCQSLFRVSRGVLGAAPSCHVVALFQSIASFRIRWVGLSVVCLVLRRAAIFIRPLHLAGF